MLAGHLKRHLYRQFLHASSMIFPMNRGAIQHAKWLILVCIIASGYQPLVADELSAAISAGERTMIVKADVFSEWKSGYSAKIWINNQEHDLRSSEGNLIADSAAAETEQTPRGAAVMTTRTLHYPEHGVNVIYRFGRVSGCASLIMQVGVKNVGTQEVRLVSVTPLDAQFRLQNDEKHWRLTALNDSGRFMKSVHLFDEMRQPLQVRECGSMYRDDGEGFLFGPVGAPVAFVSAWISQTTEGQIKFGYVADMSRVKVEPNETRWGQQVALMFDSPNIALPAWADWVAKTHEARHVHGALSGWNSWNFLGGQVSGKDIIAVVDRCVAMPQTLRPQVIEIDGGFEDPSGAKDSNERFPEGLEFYAQKISSTGAKPGILLEMTTSDTHVISWQEAVAKAQSFVKKGFTYIKINSQNLSWGTPPASDRLTSFEFMREGFSSIRKAVGNEVYLLNGDLKPNRAAVGFVDAHRIGEESKRDNLRPTIDDALRNFHIQGSWGTVDADAYYLGTELENVSSINGGWPLVRTWTSMVGISGGAAITSDPWYWDSFQAHLRNIEIMNPPAQLRARVLDLCTSHEYPRIISKSVRSWGEMTVALLWNPGSAERNISLDFSEAEMLPDRRYAVWSFWDNRFLGVAKGSWHTPSLAPSASQHLCFTDLDANPDRPVLIGSSLHISCGVAEIQRVTSLQGGMEIVLTDAGARAGDLFIYSRLPPTLKTATGCVVEKIAYAGENVWRIALTERQLGVPQRIEMGIQLPYWKQPLFAILIGLAAVSMVIAAWRYLAGLRLAREHELYQERSRIAQDLHDNIGANLAQIGLLTEQVENSLDQPLSQVKAQLDRIYQVSHATARDLDAVVWSVNPSHDTLEEFARYIHGYAENFLTMAGVRCHFTNRDLLPYLPLSSTMRHHLLMIVKEALHNVVEHAQATLVTVYIGYKNHQLVMEISDNGRGLSSHCHRRDGNGLQNMRSRAKSMNGSCDIQSNSAENGTTVRILVSP